jgi:hypothetical protein
LKVEVPPWTGFFDRTSPSARHIPITTLRIIVSNEPLPPWARWMLREPAMQCSAKITFYDSRGHSIYNTMCGRWANSPQPIPIKGVFEGKELAIMDQERLTLTSRINIYPNERELLDIVTREDGTTECVGWNNELYFPILDLSNSKWRFPEESYLVKVSIFSSGQKLEKGFHLENKKITFYLAPATEDEEKLIFAKT